MNEITSALVSIAMAIVGLAIVAVLVSKNAKTSAVVQAASAGFGNDILAAVSPVSGSGMTGYLQYPSMF